MSVATEVVELLKQINDGDRDVDDLEEDDIVEALNRITYGHDIDVGSTNKCFAFSLLNVREEYQKKFLTTALIGFLYRQSDEYGVPDSDYVKPVSELDKDSIKKQFIKENVINGKVVLKQQKKSGVSGGEDYVHEESVENKYKRIVVREFLDELFTFNPDKHVRSAYSRNPHDPERKKVNPNRKKTNIYTKYNKPDAKSTPEEIALREYGRVTEKIPPADLFHNLKYYMDSNYDALRIAVRDLYAEKPDIEYTIKVYDDFDSMEQYRDFIHQHEDRVTCEIKCCQQNKWTHVAPFGANRDKLDFYNRNTRVLQELMESNERDQKMGRDLMNKRIRRKKKQNIEECGPDDKKVIADYKREQRAKHKKAGLKNVTDIDRAQQELEARYTTAMDKNAADIDDYNAIEVPVWTLEADKKNLRPDSFFSEAEAIDQDRAKIFGGDA